jgi:hypothetical protein
MWNMHSERKFDVKLIQKYLWEVDVKLIQKYLLLMKQHEV